MRTVAFPCKGFVISWRQMTCQRAYLYADPKKGRRCADDNSISVDVSWMERGEERAEQRASVAANKVVQVLVRAWELD